MSGSAVCAIPATDGAISRPLTQGQQRLLDTLWTEIGTDLPEWQELLLQARELPEVLETYALQLESLGESCARFGLDGLETLFSLLAMQVQAAGETAEPALMALLQLWPERVQNYLQQGASEASCLQLLDYLESPGWLAQPDPEDIQTLLQSLLELNPRAADEAATTRPSTRQASAADVELQPAARPEGAVWQAFLQDAPQQAAALFVALAELEDPDASLREQLHQAQRAAHTLKGAANLLGLKSIASLSHALEDIFETLESRNQRPDDALYALLLEASDGLSSQVDYLQGLEPLPSNRLALLQRLLDWQTPQPDACTMACPSPPITGPEFTEPVAPPAATAGVTGPAAPEVPTDVPPDSSGETLQLLTEEMSINTVQAREVNKRIQALGQALRDHDIPLRECRENLAARIEGRRQAHPKRHTGILPADAGLAELDPLEMDRYDELHRSAHQYFESVADLRELNHKLLAQLQLMDTLVYQQHRFIEQLQHHLVSSQRIAVESLASRLERCVREACRMTGKQAALVIEGGRLRVDRHLLERLADPLMHLLRNAVDHGLEAPEARQTQGKPAEGRIRISFRLNGRLLEIRLSDDGRGLDFPAIHQRALARGLLPASASSPSPEQLERLIWLPGFSTRDQATQVSGRGIGLDAVKYSLERLGGSVRYDVGGDGCAWEIRLPMREITQYLLLVEVAGHSLALLTTSIRQILPNAQNLLEDLAGTTLMTLEGECLPCLDLGQQLYNQPPGSDLTSKPVLITQVNDRLTAITVDRLLGGDQLVVRSPGRLASRIFGLSGLTVLGNGTLVPVLNLNEVLNLNDALNNQPDSVPSSASPLTHTAQPARPRLLVVDDSLSVRSCLRQLLQDSGFTVDTACDGVNAMEKLRQQPADLLLVDMEMPRMNGLELTRHLRQQTQWARLPIVMLTSRSQDKHRQLAEKAGVNDYCTKPYRESELLDTLWELLA